MSKHFQLMDFLRRPPKNLVQHYCERKGILRTFDWGTGKKCDADRVAHALREEGDDIFRQTTLDFHAIWNLEGQGFTRGVLNEARFHSDDDAYDTLSALTHLGKAFWTFLNRPDWVAKAKVLSDVDKLPVGAWIKRKGLPARAGSVDPSVVERLQDGIIAYFSETQHRGFNCKIDCLRRGDEEIFFAFAEDHPDMDLFWENGQLEPHVLTPPFKLIFKHNDRQKTLEIYIEDDRTIVPDLQQVFARTVIGDEIPRDAPVDEQIYRLDRILEPGFQFQHTPDLGIAEVRVTKMRYRIEGEPWRRLLAEADTLTSRNALEEFVTALTSKLPKSRLVLDQVCINVLFHKRQRDRRARSRTFFITAPHSLRLKQDDLGEKIVEMLVQSGVEETADDSET